MKTAMQMEKLQSHLHADFFLRLKRFFVVLIFIPHCQKVIGFVKPIENNSQLRKFLWFSKDKSENEWRGRRVCGGSSCVRVIFEERDIESFYWFFPFWNWISHERVVGIKVKFLLFSFQVHSNRKTLRRK